LFLSVFRFPFSVFRFLGSEFWVLGSEYGKCLASHYGDAQSREKTAAVVDPER
jgi:hypothetical protein